MSISESTNIGVHSAINEWLKEIVSSKVLTGFEPEKEILPNVRIGQARYISNRLARTSDDSFICFPSDYGRHTTLAGIWYFLKQGHEREYLVTAFGKRRGQDLSRPAQFHGLHISYGGPSQVNFSPNCLDYLQKHIVGVSNSEVLICHNHPRNGTTEILSQLMDWGPLPSNTDRQTLLHFKYIAFMKWLETGDLQHLRFFLVEHERLREFLLPPANIILDKLKALQKN